MILCATGDELSRFCYVGEILVECLTATGQSAHAEAQVVNKGATVVTLTDATNPDYVGSGEVWTVQVSPVAPAAIQPAFVTPSGGSGSAKIGDFAGSTVTITALGPGSAAVPATPFTVILDATGHATFSFTPVSASNITYQASYPGNGAWLASTGTLSELGATRCSRQCACFGQRRACCNRFILHSCLSAWRPCSYDDKQVSARPRLTWRPVWLPFLPSSMQLTVSCCAVVNPPPPPGLTSGLVNLVMTSSDNPSVFGEPLIFTVTITAANPFPDVNVTGKVRTHALARMLLCLMGLISLCFEWHLCPPPCLFKSEQFEGIY